MIDVKQSSKSIPIVCAPTSMHSIQEMVLGRILVGACSIQMTSQLVGPTLQGLCSTLSCIAPSSNPLRGITHIAMGIVIGANAVPVKLSLTWHSPAGLDTPPCRSSVTKTGNTAVAKVRRVGFRRRG